MRVEENKHQEDIFQMSAVKNVFTREAVSPLKDSQPMYLESFVKNVGRVVIVYHGAHQEGVWNKAPQLLWAVATAHIEQEGPGARCEIRAKFQTENLLWVKRKIYQNKICSPYTHVQCSMYVNGDNCRSSDWCDRHGVCPSIGCCISLHLRFNLTGLIKGSLFEGSLWFWMNISQLHLSLLSNL